ncbi:hypothetical protein [Streptomyces niveus]|uniref:hypothetical protein n=1 Tax=Streptomyces niveus TaxID=193462 RepID=UPI0033CBE859
MGGVVGHNYAPTGRQLTVSPHTAGDGQDEPPQGAPQYRAEPGGGERDSRRRPGAARAAKAAGDGTAPPTAPPRPALAPLAGRAGRERESDPRAAASASAPVPGDRRAAPQPSRHGAPTRTRTGTRT